MVLGGQGADADGVYRHGERRKAICEMKHFDAYSVEGGRNTARDTFDISLRDLVDYYFVPLKACIQLGDVGAFMCSYGRNNDFSGLVLDFRRGLPVKPSKND